VRWYKFILEIAHYGRRAVWLHSRPGLDFIVLE
jgi:hypothetical protein